MRQPWVYMCSPPWSPLPPPSPPFSALSVVSFPGRPMTWMLEFLNSLADLLDSVNFFFFGGGGWFYVLAIVQASLFLLFCLTVHWFFLLPLYSAFQLIHWSFCLGTVLLISNNFIWFFFIPTILVKTFYFFSETTLNLFQVCL